MTLNPDEEAQQHEDEHQQDHQKRLTVEQIEFEERRKQRARDAKIRLHQIAARRESVFALTSRGNSQLDTSKMLGISQSQVSLDLQYLRSEFKRALRNHIEYELPLIYNQSMRGLSDVIKLAYVIHDTPGVPETIKLHTLQLIANVQEQRFELACSGEVIQSGISYISALKGQLNGMVRAVPQDQVREMLHEEMSNAAASSDTEEADASLEDDDTICSDKDKNSANTGQNNEVFSNADSMPISSKNLEKTNEEEKEKQQNSIDNNTEEDPSDVTRDMLF